MERRVVVKQASAGTERAERSGVSKRRQQRLDIRQVVRYHVLEIAGGRLEQSRLGTTLASDISQDGVFLSHVALSPGTQLHYYFELPDGYVECVGKVVHSDERVDAFGVSRPGAGVRFLRMADLDRARLARFLAGKQRGHRIPDGPGRLTAAG